MNPRHWLLQNHGFHDTRRRPNVNQLADIFDDVATNCLILWNNWSCWCLAVQKAYSTARLVTCHLSQQIDYQTENASNVVDNASVMAWETGYPVSHCICQRIITPHRRWWEVMFSPASVSVCMCLWTTSWHQFKSKCHWGRGELNFGRSKVKSVGRYAHCWTPSSLKFYVYV